MEGTATPSMETYYNTQKGNYRLLEMPTRADNKTMPWVRVIDMRSEASKKKRHSHPFTAIERSHPAAH
ncbi:MAG: hypothetical protein P8L18_07060 [Verrucomicrobiota bacterium]|nr:hypothetical protein [Verrucomicrobiota bacterium]